MKFARADHVELPGWMKVAPMVGAILIAVPVVAQRGWSPSAVVLAAGIVAIAVVDYLCLAPQTLSTILTLGAVYLLMRSGDSSDVAPFYFVALSAVSAATNSTRRALIVTGSCVAVAALVHGHHDLGGFAIWTFGVLLAHLGGVGVGVQTRLTAELRAAQHDLAQRAAEDERQRIAREVHDVIAHSLTVTMLHLTGARLSLEHGDAAEAADALREAERLGLQSLGDIRRVVGVLGSPDATAAPQPSGPNIPALVDEYRNAGLDVNLLVDGDLGALSPATGLGLYRIMQEALANVGRHAPGATTRAAIRVGGDDVELTVHNPVTVRVPSAPAAGDGGLGIEGMRTRAAALGGTCTAGPAGEDGWQVRAVLPQGSS